MRIRVIDVLDLLANGLSAQQVLEELPDLELEDIKACLQYASRKLNHPVLVGHDLGGCSYFPCRGNVDFGRVWPSALSLRELELRQAKDKEIFAAARQGNAIVMTKDADFAEMVDG
jgi:hypothetical protein